MPVVLTSRVVLIASAWTKLCCCIADTMMLQYRKKKKKKSKLTHLSTQVNKNTGSDKFGEGKKNPKGIP